MRRTLLPFLALCTGIASAEVTNIGSRRELFVDKLLIDQMKGATLQLHHPQEAGIAVKFDQPWEGRFSAYITVFTTTRRTNSRCITVAMRASKTAPAER